MLIALWLAITWLLYGNNNNATDVLEHDGQLQTLGRVNLCPFACDVADSIMSNILESGMPSSPSELHAQCGVAKFLVNICWNSTRYGTNCVPQSGKVKNGTHHYDLQLCTESYLNRGNVICLIANIVLLQNIVLAEYQQHAPCFWKWAEGNSLCADEYNEFINRFDTMPKEIRSNGIGSEPLCCSYGKFLRCASKGTSPECSLETNEFFETFMAQLVGETVSYTCSKYSQSRIYNRTCNL